MTEGAIFPKLVKFSVPLILSSILQLLFTAADIVVLGALAFGRSLLGIYSENQAVIDAGMLRLSVILVTCCMSGMMDSMADAIRGIGHSVLPMVITLIGACVFRVVYLTTFFQIPRFHTYQCIFYSYPLSWGLTFAFLTVSFVLIMRKIERR